MADRDPAPLLESIEEAIHLLEGYSPDSRALAQSDPLPSLLEQCEALCARAAQDSPVRSLHHFACTGGTLIARCIAALPNTQTLSEINPLSRLHLRWPRKPFFPTDILADLHMSARPVSHELIIEVFCAGLLRLRDGLAQQGQHLVIRDHAHSQFCTDPDQITRPTLRQMLLPHMTVLSVVTLRHPLDSFLSLDAQNWTHFSPFTIEEYCTRYIAFLEAYEGVPQIRYEDFVADPVAGLDRICTLLDLPRDPCALDMIEAISLSGDSGRSNSNINQRPRRPVPGHIAEQIKTSAAYDRLCMICDYDPA